MSYEPWRLSHMRMCSRCSTATPAELCNKCGRKTQPPLLDIGLEYGFVYARKKRKGAGLKRVVVRWRQRPRHGGEPIRHELVPAKRKEGFTESCLAGQERVYGPGRPHPPKYGRRWRQGRVRP